MEWELVQNTCLRPMCWGRPLEVTLSLHDAEYPPGPRRLKGPGNLQQGRVFRSFSGAGQT